jgi:transcriptional regulator with XRE-family HTH domain
MSRKKIDHTIPNQALLQLKELGKNVFIARKRRKITKRDLAERMFVSIPTLNRLENGDPSVGIGIVASALWCLGLYKQISKLADPDTDEIGKTMDLRRLKKTLNKLDNDF